MARDDHFANGTPVSPDRTSLGRSAVITATRFAWLPRDLSSGDEGSYPNSVAPPSPCSINVPPLLFGFVYHRPYQGDGSDIVALRMANVTLTMALGWICRFLMIRHLWMADWPHAAALSAGISNLRYTAFVAEMLIPGYNALTLLLSIDPDGDDQFAAGRAAGARSPPSWSGSWRASAAGVDSRPNRPLPQLPSSLCSMSSTNVAAAPHAIRRPMRSYSLR